MANNMASKGRKKKTDTEEGSKDSHPLSGNSETNLTPPLAPEFMEMMTSVMQMNVDSQERERQREEARANRERGKEEVRQEREDARLEREEARRIEDAQKEGRVNDAKEQKKATELMDGNVPEDARKAELKEQRSPRKKKKEDIRLAQERGRRRAGKDAPNLRPLTDVQELETLKECH